MVTSRPFFSNTAGAWKPLPMASQSKGEFHPKAGSAAAGVGSPALVPPVLLLETVYGTESVGDRCPFTHRYVTDFLGLTACWRLALHLTPKGARRDFTGEEDTVHGRGVRFGINWTVETRMWRKHWSLNSQPFQRMNLGLRLPETRGS